MWIKDRDKMQNIINQTGSKFAACMYTAKKGRQLQQKVNNVITESEALSWAITDDPPENLEIRLQNQAQNFEKIETPDKTENILANINEDNIREAVISSYHLSTHQKQIVFDYNGIKDKGIRTRIRILTRMLFLN